MVFLQRIERLLKRSRHRLELPFFVCAEVVRVLVQWFAGVDAVLDSVQTCHKHRGERQVGIGGVVGWTELQALAHRGVSVDRNAHGGAAVPGRVDQVDRGLITRHKPLVGVCGRRAERHQRPRVLEQTAGIVLARFAEEGVPLLIEERGFAVLPEALVRVHPGAVVGEERLWHERSNLIVLVRHVLDDVAVPHHVVSHHEQRAEPHVDLTLSRGRYLVVMHLDNDAHLRHRQYHLAADVLQRVVWRDREVAFFETRLVPQVRLLVTTAVPFALYGVDVVVAGVWS